MGQKLTIRDWQPEDMPKLAHFHAQMQVGYQLPESFGPLFCVKKAVCDENGRILGMATVKLVGEAFLWLNPEISSLEKARSAKILHGECSREATQLGLEEVSCWIPEKIAKCFARVIEKLGWRPSPWRNWTVVLK
jgi:hypothetical protein